jgi:hypothetical protein
MAIYNNDKDPNDIQWEKEQIEIQILEPRRRFEQWYKENEERILAVLGKDGKLTYETPITSDVEGYLSEDDVTRLLEQIQNL